MYAHAEENLINWLDLIYVFWLLLVIMVEVSSFMCRIMSIFACNSVVGPS